MSDSRAWEGNNMWWANPEQQIQMQGSPLQNQPGLEHNPAISSSGQTPQNQMFSYKMASTFENTNTSNSNCDTQYSSQQQQQIDYSQQGQWWGFQQSQQDMHGTGLQGLQNMSNQQQQSMQNHGQQDAQSRQEEAQRQEVTRQHQEAVQRQQQEEYRQHQEAIQQHRQAIAEAQARHHQLQQQTHQLQQQLQLQNNHHQVLQQQQQFTQPHKGRMPKKADAKPRGRMTAYAFFVQTCREEHKKKHPEENVVFAEFSKKCAERWKTMLDKEKKRFHEMAETDKKRYDTEMQSYTPPKGEKQRGKKRKQQKDPNAPKRSLSAFFWFSNDERAKVKAQNPEYGVGDIAKELGRRWADADPEARAKFEALADKDKARYEKEMTAYKKKNNPAAQQSVPEEEPEEDEEVEEEDDD
ncbi:high mobility group protein DSP1-like isoform X2 [Anthonomus grandis grandis]|uniref:high mobility group protein DSP1-like isoform X2 n=1 Tax=Anthonomus grandis grandis TaxID=2921223 RepID=UPI002165A7A7|nr:high mobility group protein DSP1-like isoform X2 [Anthonomus grandis grandis]